MAKNLRELIALLPDAAVSGNDDKIIEALVYDSRKAVPGSLFVCLTGSKVDGHDYIAQAQQRGAIAAIVERDIECSGEITVIKVDDTRKAMQLITPYFYDYPGRKLRMIGITGTNGKTTTTYLIRSILRKAGYKVGLIGTIQTMIGDEVFPVKNTTPDVIDLQKILAEMVASGMDYVVMEVSSHALALGRTAGCEYDIGVFTNMTRDHLDFHVTFDNYMDAKAELFRMVSAKNATKTNKAAVINIDDPAASYMLQNVNERCKAITYSVRKQASLMAKDVRIRSKGVCFTATGVHGSVALQLKITGMFNVYNVLAAFGVAVAEGIDTAIIKQALEEFQSVPGRFELVTAGQPFSVIVDYAHTPDGLENILKTASEFAQNRIIVVFGCGGDRDRTKRPIMGSLAAKYADIIIATSDNPRTEDPLFILQEIETGIKQAISDTKYYEIILDRRQAIEKAIRMAEPQDIVIIAGKGHETYQVLKDKTIPFDDREVAREIIRELR